MRTTPNKVSLAALAACAALTLFCWLDGRVLGVALNLPHTGRVLVWPAPWWSLAVFVSALPLGFTAWRLSRGVPAGTPAGKAVHVLSPLALLPLSLYGPLLRFVLPQPLSANIVFFLPLVVFSVVLFRWVRLVEAGAGTLPRVKDSIAAGLVAAVFYLVAGVYFTLAVGPHSGDEGHYISQAESLWRDHDLDIRNNLGTPEARSPSWNHISPFSRDGRWYSVHAMGLPLLLAPAVPGGVAARHIILALLSGFGCAAMIELCRFYRARRLYAWLITGLVGLSCFWGVYSSRCLPEVAGATFAAWGLLAILRARDWPRASLVLALAVIGYLPWMHSRFIPVSMVWAGFYGLAVLLSDETIGRKLVRAFVFSALYAVSIAGFFAFQRHLFLGGWPQSPERLLFSEPWGMWSILASDRGVLIAFPLFAGLLAAGLCAAVSSGSERWGARMTAILFVVVLCTGASTKYHTGGSCVPGRFLVVMTPILVPFLVLAFARLGAAARGWLLFCGLFSCALFVLELARLPEYSKSFADPRGASAIVYGLLDGLAKPLTSDAVSLLHPAGMLLLAGTFCLLAVRSGGVAGWSMVAAMAAGVALTAVGEPPTRTGPDVGLNAERLKGIRGGEGNVIVQPLDGRALRRMPVFQASDRLWRFGAPGATTRDLGTLSVGRLISQPRIDVNDWSGHGYRWVTMVPPFETPPGPYVCRIRGRIEGDIDVVWAVRQGNRTLFETRLSKGSDGAVSALGRFDCRRGGDIRILVRLDGGEGALTDVSISWSPFPQRLMQALGLTLE